MRLSANSGSVRNRSGSKPVRALHAVADEQGVKGGVVLRETDDDRQRLQDRLLPLLAALQRPLGAVLLLQDAPVLGEQALAASAWRRTSSVFR